MRFSVLCLVFLSAILLLATATDAISENEILHRPYFNPIIASMPLTSISTILSGFAFATIIMILRSRLSSDEKEYDDFITFYRFGPIALLIAFWGFISAAIVFSTMSGEEILTPQSTSEELLGALCISLGIIFMFWSIALFADACLSSETSSFARHLLWIVSVVCTFMLIITLLDPIMIFEQLDKPEPYISPITYVGLAVIGFFPIGLGFLITRFLGFRSRVKSSLRRQIYRIFYADLVLIFGLLVLFFANGFLGDEFQMPLFLNSIFVFCFSLISITLILLLPFDVKYAIAPSEDNKKRTSNSRAYR